MIIYINENDTKNYNKGLEIINNQDNISGIIVKAGLKEGNIIKFLKGYKDKSLLLKTIVIDDVRCSAYNNIDRDYSVYTVLNSNTTEEELNEIIEFMLESQYDPNKTQTYERITILLKKMGISPNVNGFHYLRKAIYESYRNPRLLQSFTRTLYPMISREFNKNLKCIERSIRSAVENGWLRSDYELSERLFGDCLDYEKTKPTNGEFIATLVDELKIDDGKYDY